MRALIFLYSGFFFCAPRGRGWAICISRGWAFGVLDIIRRAFSEYTRHHMSVAFSITFSFCILGVYQGEVIPDRLDEAQWRS